MYQNERGKGESMGGSALAVLTATLLLAAPISASGAITPGEEKTTVELEGESALGQFTIFLQQTRTGSNDIVFVARLNTNSNYDFFGCENALPAISPCWRSLWVAVVTPSFQVWFLQVSGSQIFVQPAGSLATLPTFQDRVFPYVVLRGDSDNPLTIPYPSSMPLFGLTQTIVNVLSPGNYTIFAAFTTWERFQFGANSLTDLISHATSNIAQWNIFVAPPVDVCSAVQTAGGDTPDTRKIEMGKTAGTFRFDFQTFDQEDRIIVRYPPGQGGTVLFDTGCVGSSATVFRSYSGNSTQVEVEVIPNCAGGRGTAWNYTVHCPQ